MYQDEAKQWEIYNEINMFWGMEPNPKTWQNSGAHFSINICFSWPLQFWVYYGQVIHMHSACLGTPVKWSCGIFLKAVVPTFPPRWISLPPNHVRNHIEHNLMWWKSRGGWSWCRYIPFISPLPTQYLWNLPIVSAVGTLLYRSSTPGSVPLGTTPVL